MYAMCESSHDILDPRKFRGHCNGYTDPGDRETGIIVSSHLELPPEVYPKNGWRTRAFYLGMSDCLWSL